MNHKESNRPEKNESISSIKMLKKVKFNPIDWYNIYCGCFIYIPLSIVLQYRLPFRKGQPPTFPGKHSKWSERKIKDCFATHILMTNCLLYLWSNDQRLNNKRSFTPLWSALYIDNPLGNKTRDVFVTIINHNPCACTCISKLNQCQSVLRCNLNAFYNQLSFHSL